MQNLKNKINEIPKPVAEILKKLEKAGFEAYIVGGCVRDLLLDKKPKDWDVTTNARPEEIIKIFSTFAGATADKPATFYENEFGTVGVKVKDLTPTLSLEKERGNTQIVEITTYRVESKYSDKRHPDEVKFAKTLEEDLSRRDFTINALALEIIDDNFNIVDLFSGQEDLKKRIIRAVGEAEERFAEDALRMMRAVRFVSQLDFSVEEKTLEAIKKNAKN